MKSVLFALVLLCTSVFSHSQTIKAQDVENICTAKSDSDRAMCVLLVKTYMDGFIEGVAKGVLDTYKLDPEVRNAVKDIKMKDALPRFNRVVVASTCIQKVSVAEMTNTFLEYLRSNPVSRQDHYRTVMTRSIVSKYCNK